MAMVGCFACSTRGICLTTVTASRSPAATVKLLRLCSSALIRLASCSSERTERISASVLPGNPLTRLITNTIVFLPYLISSPVEGDRVGVGGLQQLHHAGLHRHRRGRRLELA